MNRDEIIVRATELMREAGIYSGLRGYRQLRYAICEVVNDPTYLDLAITKRLYPKVAEEFNSTPVRVERDIRQVVMSAWNADPERMRSVVMFMGSKKAPTNGYVIASIADAIIVEDLKKNSAK